MNKHLAISLSLFFAAGLCAQQPQTQSAPISPINAKYVQGSAPGYWPTAGSGLALNLTAGTANCAGTIVTYAGGSLTMTSSTTNYVYLDIASSCAPAVKTAAFTSSDIPIATVVAGASAITTIADDRTMFQEGSGSGGGGSVNVNSASVSSPNFNNSTPAADSGYVNGTFRVSGSNVSVEVPTATGGVQYNPSTAIYYLASSSILMDDSRALSSAVTAGAWTCNGTLCTFNTTSAHGYKTGDYVDLKGVSGWPNAGAWRTYVDVFPVTVTSTTQFTFPYTLGSPSGTGSSLYLATYWGAYQAANQPFIKGHGKLISFYSWAGDPSSGYPSLSTNFSSLVNCAAGTPSYLILQVGLNDIVTGEQSVSQVETSLQSIWQQAHAAGCVVVQTTLLNTHLGYSDNDDIWKSVAQLNQWMASQGITNANNSSGIYWDRFIDFASYGGTSGEVGYDPSGSAIFGQRLNEAFANQGSSMNVAPLFQSWTNNAKAFTIPGSLVMLDSYTPAVYFNTISAMSNGTSRIEVHSPNTNYNSSNSVSSLFDVGSATGFVGCNLIGNQNGGSTNSQFRVCFNQIAANSASNFYSIESNNTYGLPPDWIKGLKMFSTGALQFPRLLASSGTQPLQVDTAGNVSVGSSGGGSGLSGMTGGQVPIAATGSTVTSSKPLAGTGVGIATGPTSATTVGHVVTYADTNGTLQDGGAAPVTAVSGSNPIVATTTGSTVMISCPTCGVGSEGTAVSINGGSALGSLNASGSIPVTCLDTSGSGTAQSCTTTPSFTPTAGNCITYLTTTANSGAALTINVNSSANDSVAKWAGSTTTLTAGDIPANKPIPICFDAAGYWDLMTIGNVPSGGGGPYANYVTHSLFDNGATGWPQSGSEDGTITTNAGTDIFGNTTAERIVIPAGAGQSVAQAQTTSLTMLSGSTYQFSVYMQGGAGGEITVMQLAGGSGCASGQGTFPISFRLTTTLALYSWQCTPTANTTAVPSISFNSATGAQTVYISQAQVCQVGVNCGPQIVTTIAAVTGNGAVSNGFPLGTFATANAPSTPGVQGIVEESNSGVYNTVAAPTGTVVGTSDTQTLTNKSIAGSEVNSGTIPLAQLPTGTASTNVPVGGVITAAGPIGDATSIPVITYNAAGQLTTVTTATPAVSAVNGVSYGANPSTNTVPVVTGTNTVTYEQVPSAALGPPTTTVNSGSISVNGNNNYVICTSTCTVTLTTPAAGVQLCVRNSPGSATVITLAALGSGNYYELTTHASWGTVNHTVVSGGLATDAICLVGYDANHYAIFSYNGTWAD